MKVGWKVKRLGDLYQIGSGKRVLEKQWTRTGVPFYRAREIVKLAKYGSVDNELFIANDHFEQLRQSHGIPAEGDLMVSAVGTLGACYVVQPHDRFYFKDASVLWFRPRTAIDAAFVKYAFEWDGLRDQVNASEGATVGTFTISRANATELPIPPLNEQQRIVAVLDEAFEGLAHARANAEANLQSARELLASTIDSLMASSGAAEVQTLGRLCTFENGDRGKNYPGRKAFVSMGVPFINAGHLLNGPIDWANMNFIPPDHFKRLSNGKVRRGDLLFCLRGSLGKFGTVDTDESGAIASSLVIVRPGPRLMGAYLAAYFESRKCAEMIEEFGNGAAQPNLSAKSLASFEISLPPLDHQLKVVSAVAEFRQAVDVLVQSYVMKLQDMGDLRQSLLQKAFAGELT